MAGGVMGAGSKSARDYAGHSGAPTPGPWTFFANNLDVGVSAYSADVAHCGGFHSGRSPEEEMANARLMAAAPDLLAALRPLAAMGDASIASDIRRAVRLHERESFDRAVEAARSAIAKAEGRQS